MLIACNDFLSPNLIFIKSNRGKLMLGYSDSELAALGGYDLVHYDDLSYISSAHQERKLIKFYVCE